MPAALTQSPIQWKGYEKILFRVFSIYFVLLSVPLDWKYFKKLFSIQWATLNYGDIFNLAHYHPIIIGPAPSYGDWLILFVIALAGAAIWTYAEKDSPVDYTRLSYWARVIVRYRLAAALIAYGFIKFFPLQAPYPSISNLNTAYGDFNRWKIFSITLGIVPSYELFLGLVEIILGVLLLNRRTASISAFLILIFTGNVFVSNIAYEGGEQVYSFYLITLALFIFSFDLIRVYNLIILQKPALPNRWKPSLNISWQKFTRLGLKGSFILFFIVLYGFKTRDGYINNPYQYPITKGVDNLVGIYNVAEFKINDTVLPYSKIDPQRWQDVVFEKWNTISIRSNRPVVIDSSNTDVINSDDRLRAYELEGTGGRHYYSYSVDDKNENFVLTNKNKNYNGDSIQFSIISKTKNGIVLKGVDQNKDSINVVLEKIDRKYLLEEAAKTGRRRGLKL